MNILNNNISSKFDMNNKWIFPQLLVVVLSLGTLLLNPWNINGIVSAQAADTCPDDNGWTKIDSGNLDSYPVNNAVEYCFKAGNFLADSIPDGGFGQDGGCEEAHIERCDLSHWSYRVDLDPSNTPTPTSTPTSTPTISPTATLTPTSTPTITPTPTEVECDPDSDICVIIDCPEGGECLVIIGDPTPTPTPSVTPVVTLTPIPTQTPTSTPTEEQDEPEGDGEVQTASEGEVLGAETLGATGRGTAELLKQYMLIALGSILILKATIDLARTSEE